MRENINYKKNRNKVIHLNVFSPYKFGQKIIIIIVINFLNSNKKKINITNQKYYQHFIFCTYFDVIKMKQK